MVNSLGNGLWFTRPHTHYPYFIKEWVQLTNGASSTDWFRRFKALYFFVEVFLLNHFEYELLCVFHRMLDRYLRFGVAYKFLSFKFLTARLSSMNAIRSLLQPEKYSNFSEIHLETVTLFTAILRLTSLFSSG